ncbi:MAG: hypothetical protein H6Q17_1861 [Bacteroidetes bacterium]|nr:hypothetical protein [Bacteroidota bacterium]
MIGEIPKLLALVTAFFILFIISRQKKVEQPSDNKRAGLRVCSFCIEGEMQKNDRLTELFLMYYFAGFEEIKRGCLKKELSQPPYLR